MQTVCKKRSLFPICSHKADRAPCIGKYTFFLCYRCTGLIIGYAFTLFISKAEKSALQGIALMSLMPIDVLFQSTGTPSTNTRRIITGILFSVGLLVFGMKS